jgi:hypothetical protein
MISGSDILSDFQHPISSLGIDLGQLKHQHLIARDPRRRLSKTSSHQHLKAHDLWFRHPFRLPTSNIISMDLGQLHQHLIARDRTTVGTYSFV